MPPRPRTPSPEEAALLTVYLDAERYLLATIRDQVGATADAADAGGDVDARRYAGLQQVREAVETTVRGLERGAPARVERILGAAAEQGVDVAVAELAAVSGRGATSDVGDTINRGALDRLAASVLSLMTEAHRSILRTVPDAYRTATARTVSAVLVGAQTRREASQRAMLDLLGRGITSFTDRGGRRWRLSSYVEMSVRTAAARAHVDAQLDRLAAGGHDLVIVSDAPRECSLCLVPGTVVEGPVPTWRTRSEYIGYVVSIRTASGKDLTGTPDHPVLTPGGWRRLQDLRPGDQVVSDRGQHGLARVVPDDVQVPALIEEAGEAVAPLLLAGPARRDLDSDVVYREVHHVGPHSDLLAVRHPAFIEPSRELDFVGRVGAAPSFLAAGDPFLVPFGEGDAARGRVRCGGPVLPFFGGGVVPPLTEGALGQLGALFGGRSLHERDDVVFSRPGLHAGSAQVVTDYAGADAEGRAQLLRRLARDVALDERRSFLVAQPGSAASRGGDPVRGEECYQSRLADLEGGQELLRRLATSVAADEIVDVSVRQYSGHVWDLSTGPAWFSANGIVTHNCAPWEGKILSRGGSRGRIVVEHGINDGEMVEVDVAGTVDQARRDGLLHPNCRHSLSLYIPGVTRPIEARRDPDGYQAGQRQREIERHIRAWKERQAAAIGDTDRRHAAGKVRAWQAAMRDHLRAHPELKRLPYREGPGAGNAPTRSLRDRLGEQGPTPTLVTGKARTPRQMSDPELDRRMRTALAAERFDDFERLADETDRRDARRVAQREQRAADRERREQQQGEEFDRLLDAGMSEEQATAQAYGIPIERQRRDRAIADLRGNGYTGRSFDELSREAYRDHVWRLYTAAEDALGTAMLTPEAKARGVDERDLFTGPEARARKWASPELRAWWDEHGRPTLDEFRADLLGDTGAARALRGGRGDFLT